MEIYCNNCGRVGHQKYCKLPIASGLIVLEKYRVKLVCI